FDQKQELDEKLVPVRETPENSALREDNRSYLRRMLLKLDPDLRYILILRDIEELSYTEIAEKLQIPEGTVKSRISVGKRLLKEQLLPLLGEEVS
ncbi:MAG: RNA polymerase sigma factor, partial [Candidatus Methylomirabilales bacterium]